MKIASLILMAFMWLSSGFHFSSAIFWSIEEDRKEMIRSVIRTVFAILLGFAWIVLIYARYMS